MVLFRFLKFLGFRVQRKQSTHFKTQDEQSIHQSPYHIAIVK